MSTRVLESSNARNLSCWADVCGRVTYPRVDFASWSAHGSADTNKNKSASIEFDLDTVKMLMNIFVSPLF